MKQTTYDTWKLNNVPVMLSVSFQKQVDKRGVEVQTEDSLNRYLTKIKDQVLTNERYYNAIKELDEPINYSLQELIEDDICSVRNELYINHFKNPKQNG